jgi:hypothetical protein
MVNILSFANGSVFHLVEEEKKTNKKMNGKEKTIGL